MTAVSVEKADEVWKGEDEEALAGRIDFERTKTLFDNLPVALVASIINASMLAFIAWGTIDKRFLMLWVFAHVIMTVVRGCMVIVYRRVEPDLHTHVIWQKWFVALAFISGMIWGSIVFGLLSLPDITGRSLTGFVLAGLTAGAVATQSMHLRSYTGFVLSALIPYILLLLFSGQSIQFAMGFMVSMYAIVLISSAIKYHANWCETLQLKYRNKGLVSRLRKAVASEQEANRAKSRFLANMSHEIRTPMNGVFGMTDLLMRTALSHRQKRLVQTVNQSAKTLLTIINDILDLSRIEAGKLELDKTSFDLRHCCETSAELFAEQAERKKIELTVFVDSEVPETVLADAGRLRQIIINLLGNAIKFTPENGEVALRVTSQRDMQHGRRDVEFTVRDTGIGIEKDVVSRILDPFTQADSSISRRFGGTGLGLSIARHLISMMGGSFNIESEKSVGTEVCFVVPLQVCTQARTSSKASDISIAGQKVIVVDDRETNLEIISTYLEDGGCSVDCFDNPKVAMAALREEQQRGKPYSVCVLDVVMPGQNGIEFAKEVKANPDLASVNLVMVSSLSWKGDTREVRQAGVSQLLSKPLRRKELQDAVARALSEDGQPDTRGVDEVVGDLARFNGHVLIVEDNPVNEEVVKEYVTGFGCTVAVARNGLEAVEAFKGWTYDLIFMDCQMPEMDGFTATRLIRGIEAENKRKRTPIVALTANAYEQDREACLDAGMDGYIAKPFSEDDMVGAASKWLERNEDNGLQRAALEPKALEKLKEKRADFVARIVRTYLRHSPKMVESLQNAIKERDVNVLKLSAHSLKSSSANVAAVELSDLCRDIETYAKDGNFNDAAPLVAQVGEVYEAVVRELKAELSEVLTEEKQARDGKDVA